MDVVKASHSHRGARKRMRPRRDRRVFSRTASSTRGVNVSMNPFRGGIRL